MLVFGEMSVGMPVGGFLYARQSHCMIARDFRISVMFRSCTSAISSSMASAKLPQLSPSRCTTTISHDFPLDKLVLAAGTLSSSKIFLQSIFEGTREIVKLPGLMDNRQVLIPFVNLKMIGRPFDPENLSIPSDCLRHRRGKACGISSRSGHDSKDGPDSSHHSKNTARFENVDVSVSESACRIGVGESEFSRYATGRQFRHVGSRRWKSQIPH